MGDLPVPGGDPNSWGTKLNTFLTDIPVGSITGALEGYGPLANMRSGTANVLDFLSDANPIAAALASDARTVVIAPNPDDPHWVIDDALTVPTGITITFQPGAVIEQETLDKPVFDCYGVSDVTIQNPNLRYEGDRTFNTPGPSFRGGGAHEYHTGIYIANSHRIKVLDAQAYGFTFGVSMSGWNGSARTSYLNTDCVVDGLVIDTVDFAVLASGFDGLTLNRIRGSYSFRPTGTGTPPPPHLLYISGNISTELSRNLMVGDCSARDGVESFAFQFKYVRGGVINNLSAYNCPGLLHFVDCEDIACANVSGTGDSTAVGYSVDVEQTASSRSKRISISGLTVNKATDTKVLSIAGDDIVVNDLNAVVAHASNTTDADIFVAQGSRNIINRPKLVNTGAGAHRGVTVASGASASVLDPVLVNVDYGVIFASGADGYCRYDPTSIVPHSSAPAKVRALDSSGVARLERMSTTVNQTVAGASTLTPRICDGTYWRYTVTTTSAVTVNVSDVQWLGAEVGFEVYNNSGGALNWTWAAGYVLRTAWSSPSDTNRVVIRFRYDGTNWQEVSRV